MFGGISDYRGHSVKGCIKIVQKFWVDLSLVDVEFSLYLS